MTNTLIARLRDWRGDPDEVMSEAANLIEALHAELKNEQRKVTELVNGYEADQEEIRKLRAELGQYPEIQAMLMKENKELRAEVERLKGEQTVLIRLFREGLDVIETLVSESTDEQENLDALTERMNNAINDVEYRHE